MSDFDRSFTEIENVTVVASTKKAGLFRFNDYPTEEPEWIPWSHVDEGSVSKDGETGTLVISTWMAKQKGFEV